MEKFLQRTAEFVDQHGLFIRDNNGSTKRLMTELEGLVPCFLMVFDLEHFQTVFLNKSAKQYLKVDEQAANANISYWLKRIHPVSMPAVQQMLIDLKRSGGSSVSAAVQVHLPHKKEYAWIYTASRVISKTPAGKPKLVCTLALDVEEMIDKCGYLHITREQTGPNGSISIVLTKREQLILEFICKEFTSKEIAGFLRISEATVESDRKKMLQKLGAKSMIGLVKYAIQTNMVSL